MRCPLANTMGKPGVREEECCRRVVDARSGMEGEEVGLMKVKQGAGGGTGEGGSPNSMIISFCK